jgi:hypothetical protein
VPSSKSRLQISSALGNDVPLNAAQLIREKLTVPPEPVMKAVERAGGRVTGADVASLAGIDLRAAQQGVMTLASIVGGDLEVTKDGDIVYVFPSNFRNILRSRSVAQRVREAFTVVWPVLFYIIRVSFGVLLLASIVLVFSSIAILSASTSSESRSDRDRDRDDRQVNFGAHRAFFDIFYGLDTLFDVFAFRRSGYGYYYTNAAPSYTVYDAHAEQPAQRGVSQVQDKNGYEQSVQMGFLEAIFSFLFGDGDPNNNFATAQLKAASQVIRENGGAVIAEQLAPYLDAPAPGEVGISGAAQDGESAIVDESFILPVVTRLGGIPRVNEDGEIVYVFQDLQLTAIDDTAAAAELLDLPNPDEFSSVSTADLKRRMQRKGISVRGALDKQSLLDNLRSFVKRFSPSKIPRLLEERKLKFSLASGTQQIFAAALGAVNLIGTSILGSLLNRPYASESLGSYAAFLNVIYGPLLLYALAYSITPILRGFWIAYENKKIEQRNRARRLWATVVAAQEPKLMKKLNAAKKMAEDMKRVESKDIYYTTAESKIFEQPNPVLSDFDRRLREASEPHTEL